MRQRDAQGRFIAVSRKATDIQYITSTVRTSERMNKYSAYDPDAAKLLGQFFGFAQICATRIAMDASMIPIRLYRPKRAGKSNGREVSRSAKRFLLSGAAGQKAAAMRSDNDLEEVVDHPILDVLYRPNPYQSGIQFRQAHTLFRKVAGSSYILPAYDTGYLHLLFPQWVSVIGGRDGMIDGYVYGRASEGQQRFGEDEIWWSKNMPNPFSPFKGLSPLSAVMTEQQIYAAVNQAELAIFDNTGRPDAIVAIEGNADKATVDKIRADVEARHNGPQNAGRMAFVSNTKLTVTPLGWAPKDLNNVELQKHAIQSILAAYGVPESEVYMNDANVASARTGNLQYLRQTVMPCAIQDAEELTTWLVEGVFGMDGWVLAPEDTIGVDKDAEATRVSAQVAAGIITLNEARRMDGWDEYPPEIGDVPRINGQAITILDEVARRPPPDPFGGLIGGATRNNAQSGGEADGSGGDSVRSETTSGGDAGEADTNGVEPKRLELPVKETSSAPASDKACCEHPHGLVKQSELWTKYVDPLNLPETAENETDMMRLYRKIVAALLARRDQIIAASNEAPHGLDQKMAGMRGTKESNDALINRLLGAWAVTEQADAFAKSLMSMTEQESRALFDTGVRVGLGQIASVTSGGTIPMLSNERSLEFYSNFKAEYIKRMAEVDETTAAVVESAIRDGIESGDGLRAMQGRIRAVFDEVGDDGQSVSEARAATIARTETANATTQGQLGGYADAGVEEYEFVLAPNPCEFCEAVAAQYEGKGVPLGTPLYKPGDVLTGTDGGTMAMDYGDTYVPIHPNCRCAIQPRVKQ